jgi:hypothetical protein
VQKTQRVLNGSTVGEGVFGTGRSHETAKAATKLIKIVPGKALPAKLCISSGVSRWLLNNKTPNCMWGGNRS